MQHVNSIIIYCFYQIGQHNSHFVKSNQNKMVITHILNMTNVAQIYLCVFNGQLAS